MAAAAICALAGERWAATTAGPGRLLAAGAPTATETIGATGEATVGAGDCRAAPLTAQANTSGVSVATLSM
jgi:hypothetical protein